VRRSRGSGACLRGEGDSVTTYESNVWERTRTATLVRSLPPDDYDTEERITARVALVKLSANPRPYFSATVDTETRRGSGRWEDAGGGADHDLILSLFPAFEPVVRVHLSDDRGEPMHAVENARYWLGLTEYQDYDRDTLCRHLRVTRDEADEIHRYVNGAAGRYSDREALDYLFQVLKLRERWQAEADTALAVIDQA
jgi:hypothetical protein